MQTYLYGISWKWAGTPIRTIRASNHYQILDKHDIPLIGPPSPTAILSATPLRPSHKLLYEQVVSYWSCNQCCRPLLTCRRQTWLWSIDDHRNNWLDSKWNADTKWINGTWEIEIEDWRSGSRANSPDWIRTNSSTGALPIAISDHFVPGRSVQTLRSLSASGVLSSCRVT